MARRRRRGRATVVVALLSAVAIAGCGSDPARPRTLATAVITPVGHDTYSVAPEGKQGAVLTAPATNVDSNLRKVFWDSNAPDLVDSYSCATWAWASDTSVQQGVALRITANAAATRAILITKNVFLGGVWVFNIQVWDTGGGGLTILRNVDLRATFDAGNVADPLPWHLCGRASGAVAEFKAWPDSVAEPSWGDERYGGSAELPAEWLSPGKAGWYIGHVPPGGAATYTELRAGSL